MLLIGTGSCEPSRRPRSRSSRLLYGKVKRRWTIVVNDGRPRIVATYQSLNVRYCPRTGAHCVPHLSCRGTFARELEYARGSDGSRERSHARRINRQQFTSYVSLNRREHFCGQRISKNVAAIITLTINTLRRTRKRPGNAKPR